MKWLNPTHILAGCFDHSLKLINVEKNLIEEIMLTNYKVPTAIDAIQDNVVLTGHEDCVVRLWDLRSTNMEKKFKQ